MLAFLAHNNLNNLNLYLGGGFYPAKCGNMRSNLTHKFSNGFLRVFPDATPPLEQGPNYVALGGNYL